MGLTYDNSERYQQNRSLNKSFQKPVDKAKKDGFPNCKGLYPDCPEHPTKDNPMCKNCPILEED